MTISRIEPDMSGKANELASILQSATNCMDKLLSLLEDERDALSTENIETIDECGRNKADCVVQLEAFDNRRAQLCDDLKLDNAEINNFLNNQHTVSVPNQWETFLVKLEKCREANAVNGSFVRIRRGHIEKALQILRGSPVSPALYGPNGLDDPNDVTHLGHA